MRVDVINSVIRSIEGQEIEGLGFNCRVYFADREKHPFLKDMSGLDRRYVGDIVAHMASLYNFAGGPRPRRLTVDDLDAVLSDSMTMVEVLAVVFDVTVDQATRLVGPDDDMEWEHVAPEIAVNMLRHFIATEEIVWRYPTHQEAKISQFNRVYGSTHGNV